MKRLLKFMVLAILVFCSFTVTACGGEKPVNLTSVSLVNNSTGFTVTEADAGIAVGLAKGSPLKASMDEYLGSLASGYKNKLMQKMVELKTKESATYSIEYNADHSTSNGTLKVGMECACAPFNWTQDVDKNGAIAIENVPGKYANGYDVQIAAQVAAYLDMKLEIYQYEWNSLVSALKDGTLTAIISSVRPTTAMIEEIDFTVPYYQSNLVIVTREGSAIAAATNLDEVDKAGIKIAARVGSFHLEALKAQTDSLTVVETYQNFNDMESALKKGTIDGYVVDEPMVSMF